MNQQKFIAILGAGESGVGAAVLAKSKGFRVFVSDLGTVQSWINVQSIYFNFKTVSVSVSRTSSLGRIIRIPENEKRIIWHFRCNWDKIYKFGNQ